MADANERMSALLDSLWNDADLGPKVRAKAKSMYDDVVIPEDHVAPIVEPLRKQLDETQAELKAIREERAASAKAREDATMRANLEDALSGARAKYHLTDDGFDKMVARMKETNNYTDADAAAAWVAHQTPVQNTTKADWLPKKMNILGHNDQADDRFKLLHNNPQEFIDSELQAFVSNPEAYLAAA